MRRSELLTNVILVVLVAVLAVICIRSVVGAQQAADKRQELRDVREK